MNPDVNTLIKRSISAVPGGFIIVRFVIVSGRFDYIFNLTYLLVCPS